MNTKLLKETRKFILQNPLRFDPFLWVFDPRGKGGFAIGGVAAIAAYLDGSSLLVYGEKQDKRIRPSIGREALGLTAAEAHQLFYPAAWPEPFRGEIMKAHTYNYLPLRHEKMAVVASVVLYQKIHGRL